MLPNIDPRQLKSMMDKMGIRSQEIDAVRVVIEGKDKDIVIENPQVIAIDAQGARSFQISGDVQENEKKVSIEIKDDDGKMVMDQSGVDDETLVRKTLEETNGDIAEAILKLKNDGK
jgi:nascent polypeptide-associated complex subunit alpha